MDHRVPMLQSTLNDLANSLTSKRDDPTSMIGSISNYRNDLASQIKGLSFEDGVRVGLEFLTTLENNSKMVGFLENQRDLQSVDLLDLTNPAFVIALMYNASSSSLNDGARREVLEMLAGLSSIINEDQLRALINNFADLARTDTKYASLFEAFCRELLAYVLEREGDTVYLQSENEFDDNPDGDTSYSDDTVLDAGQIFGGLGVVTTDILELIHEQDDDLYNELIKEMIRNVEGPFELGVSSTTLFEEALCKLFPVLNLKQIRVQVKRLIASSTTGKEGQSTELIVAASSHIDASGYNYSDNSELDNNVDL